MQIDSLAVNPGPSIFYDPAFRNVLEDHLTYLLTNEQTQVMAIEPVQAYRFEGDFFGLVANYNVAPELAWLTMRMNGFTSPTQVERDIVDIFVPNADVVGRIRQSYMSSRRIT